MKKIVFKERAYYRGSCGPMANMRNKHGATSLLALAGFMVVLLLGAISFDIFNAREQYNQLQAATDAAALATAEYLTSPTIDNTIINQVGLTYFQMNSLNNGGCLSAAALSPTAATDSPAAGVCKLNISTTASTCTAVATSAFGIQPTLLRFLGTFPVHTTSTAAPSVGLTGDVCLCIDYSDSMWCNTGYPVQPFPQYARTKPNNVTVYTLTPNIGSTPFLPGIPTLASGGVGSTFIYSTQTILDPGITPGVPPQVTFTPSALGSNGTGALESNVYGSSLSINSFDTPLTYAVLNNYANAVGYNNAAGTAVPGNPPAGWTAPVIPGTNPAKTFQILDVEEALLAEAAAGNLEDATVFATKDAKGCSASTSVLQFLPPTVSNPSGGFQPAQGYQAEYQSLALCTVQPRAGQVTAVATFINTLENNNSNSINWSVIGFGHSAGSAAQPYKNGQVPNAQNVNPIANLMWSYVGLNQTNNNATAAIQTTAMTTLSDGTDTYDALQNGINELNGAGHRTGVPKTLILLTDGMPTTGNVLDPALTSQFGSSQIQLIIVGYFESGYAWPAGNNLMTQLAAKVGNGAVYYTIGNGSWSVPFTQAEITQSATEINNALQNIALKPIYGPICLQYYQNQQAAGPGHAN